MRRAESGLSSMEGKAMSDSSKEYWSDIFHGPVVPSAVEHILHQLVVTQNRTAEELGFNLEGFIKDANLKYALLHFAHTLLHNLAAGEDDDRLASEIELLKFAHVDADGK
jgi:hypothetical protein